MPFAGAVLCGGASRRMGRDKAFADLHGEPLVLVAVRALRGAGADRVAAVGGDGPALAALGLDVVADDHPGEGPLGGLISALRWAPVDPLVVLSCDLVALGAEEVRAVLERLGSEPGADVAAPLRDGQPQFLTGAYRRRCLGPLEERFRQGERAVRRAVADCGLTLVTVEGLGVERLADVDTPAELAAYQPSDAQQRLTASARRRTASLQPVGSGPWGRLPRSPRSTSRRRPSASGRAPC